MKIKLDNHQKVFFTSDTHFNHANICSATSRWQDPTTIREFASLDQMNATLVNNINEVVGQDDILFHGGDWSFGGFEQIEIFRNRLVCKNIHIVTGNHDHHIERDRDGIRSIFSSVRKYVELDLIWNRPGKLDGENSYTMSNNFVLMHFPIASWNNMGRGSIHLHGHVHLPANRRVGVGKMMDVGVDGNNFKPLELKEILHIMNGQPIDSILEGDHHRKIETYK
jgi:calcineurin-like phosphoesterase family protein